MSNAMFLIDQSKALVDEKRDNARRAALAVGKHQEFEDLSHIIGATWFSPMGCQPIGIVLVNNGFEIKAYIGGGQGVSEIDDARDIAARGASFPLDSAMSLSYSSPGPSDFPSLG